MLASRSGVTNVYGNNQIQIVARFNSSPPEKLKIV